MADRRKKGVAAPKRSAAPAGRKQSKPATSGIAKRSTTTRKAPKRGTAKKAARTGRKAASASTRAAGARRAGTGRKKGVGSGAKEIAPPTKLMRIRALDPQATCGQGTTVLQLFRVDDLPFGSYTTHLVFFDRHGWYCEHGRECPAVAAVRRHEKHVTLTR